MAEKHNPKQGYSNPFYRDSESTYSGGDRAITSPVGSVFSHDYLRRDGSNVMEDTLKQQLGGHQKRAVVGKKGKK